MSKSEYTCDCNIIHEQAVEEVNLKMPPAHATDRASAFFKVLGDPTRFRMICALSCAELCVCDLANVMGMTKSAVSHQLATLRNANLVKFRREGKSVFYTLADEHVRNMLKSGLEHVHP